MIFSRRLPKEKSDFWGSSDPAFECLVDYRRTIAFLEIIKKKVNINDIVVDAGAGTGILSFAASKRAKKVYAIERDPHLCFFMQETIKRNGIKNVEVINDDVLQVKLQDKANVLITEMISTGLIDELQIPTIQHLKKNAQPNAKFIPCGISNYVDLVQANDIFYGIPMFIVRYEYTEYKKTKATVFSDKYEILNVNFAQDTIHLDQDHSFELKIKKNGEINGIRISSVTNLDSNKIFYHSFAYAMPLILPIPTVKVQKGDSINIKIKYTLSGGLGSLSYSIKE